jgi:hypothetical protein
MKHLKVDQKYKRIDERSNEVFIINKIDEDFNATWITVQDTKGNTLAYGKKAFKSKFQDLKEE